MFKKRGFATDADTNAMLNGKEGESMKDKGSDIRTDELIREWQRDAEQLKLIVSDFSLEEAIKNETFASALKSGATVFEAYKEMVAMPKPKERREEIFQNARSARRGTGASSLNPAKLSSEEFKKYIDNIKNG